MHESIANFLIVAESLGLLNGLLALWFLRLKWRRLPPENLSERRKLKIVLVALIFVVLYLGVDLVLRLYGRP